jgi:glycosyltransferase involved in cell wall biosynthesis
MPLTAALAIAWALAVVSIAADAAWIDVTSPSMGAVLHSPSVTVRFALRDGLVVPRDGFLRMTVNDQDPFELHEPMESVSIGDVQPGTHFFLFTFVPSISSPRAAGAVYDDALLVIERVPRAVARFAAPGPPHSRLYESAAAAASAAQRAPMRVAFIGTTKLDGQKSIWLQQIEHMQRAGGMDEAAFVCLTCDGDAEAPLAVQVHALGARFVASGELSLPQAVGADARFPENVVDLLRALARGGGACRADADAAAACAALDATLVAPLRGFDVAVFANSQEPQDVLLVEAARAAGVRAVVMDLPNLRPHAALAGRLDGVVAPSHFALLHASVQAERWCRDAIGAERGAQRAARAPCGVVVNPSVDGARFSPIDDEERARAARAAAPPLRVGFVGRVAPEKSPGLFVAAARIVRATLRRAPLASRRAVRFEVVGDGHVRRMLEAWARASAGREESGGDVEFTGWVEWAKLPARMKRFDVIVNPSLSDSETFCISNIEALASAVPLVTFGGGGVGEYMVNGTTGRVAATPSAASLAAQIVALLRAPAERRRMGAAGATMTRERFSVGTMVERYVGYYRSLLRARPA